MLLQINALFLDVLTIKIKEKDFYYNEFFHQDHHQTKAIKKSPSVICASEDVMKSTHHQVVLSRQTRI